MNIKKIKIALALGGLLFLFVPLSSAFAEQKHSEIKEAGMGGTMHYIKNELRGYVDGVKSDNAQKMQQHLNELLTLSAMSSEQIAANMQGMDHSTMAHGDMEMDHSNMDHSAMAKGDMKMDHSTMSHGDMQMDHADHDMSTMPSMEGMTPAQHHQHMIYMQGITGLNELFKLLDQTQDKTEIKSILGKIKEHIQKNPQLFS